MCCFIIKVFVLQSRLLVCLFVCLSVCLFVCCFVFVCPFFSSFTDSVYWTSVVDIYVNVSLIFLSIHLSSLVTGVNEVFHSWFVEFGSKLGQIGPKWATPGLFEIIFQYILAHQSQTLGSNLTSLVSIKTGMSDLSQNRTRLAWNGTKKWDLLKSVLYYVVSEFWLTEPIYNNTWS